MLVTDKQFYMHKHLYANLMHLKQAVKKKWDGFVMVDGIEGSAKTTLTAAMCAVVDPNYNIDNVVFTQEQFFELVDRAPVGTAIHWDEFIFGGLSTEAMNSVQNALIKKMTTIRKKRLFIFLVMPWFFMMRPYFAIGRSRCLVHTYTPDGITRGKFKFYSFNKKQRLYHEGKKTYAYWVKPDFHGDFIDTFGKFWDEEEYDKKKEAAILQLTNNKNGKVGRWEKYSKKQDGRLAIALEELRRLNYSWSQLSKLFKEPKSTVQRFAYHPEDN